jgi:Protein of unknown function (DUF4239)
MTPEHLTLEQWLGFHFTTLQLALICLGIPCLIVLGGLFLVRKSISHAHLKKHHDISGPIFCALGTVYGIFLTLIVTNTWNAYDLTATNVVQEARCLEALDQCARALPPEHGKTIRPLIRTYRDSIVSSEWPMLARGQRSEEVGPILKQIVRAFSDPSHPISDANPFYGESVRLLQKLDSLRSSRINDAQSGLLPFLWVVLLAGGALTVSFCFLFGAEDFPTHAVMTLILTLVISLGFLTIVLLDFPFTGAVRIPPTDFQVLKL